MTATVSARSLTANMVTRRRFLARAAAGLTLSLGPATAFALAERFAADPASTRTVDHRAWDSLLAEYAVTGGDGVARIRYGVFKKAGRTRLAGYLAMLQDVAIAGLGRAEQFAFWVNLYNALTVEIVLDHYPVASIRDIDLGGGLFSRGPWKKKLVRVAGTELSLDNIEHDILRPTFRDARLHYVVNCASIGCPNLPPRAVRGKTASATLDKAARDYVNHPRGVRVAGGRITASKLYQWYAEDFGGKPRLRAHWRRYARPPLVENLDRASGIAGFEYDWRLNDVGR